MTDLLAGLYTALDTIVLIAEDDGRFRLLTDPVPWALELVPVERRGECCALQGRSPFLDNFMVDAHQLWRAGGPGPLRSGPWHETSAARNEVALEATAVVHEGCRLLLVRMLGEEYEQRVATLQTSRDNRLDQEWLEAEVRKRTAQIREREEEITIRLTTAVGLRDDETGAHVRRIGHYAAIVAQSLGWAGTDVADLRVAAPMHDIGKIGIPDHILLKPGPLTKAERSVMQRHTEYGARILRSNKIGLLELAGQIALSHHEAWDGSGYPQRLRAEEIPLAARIVTVVDVYDALTHERPYKPAFSERQAITYIEDHRGTYFDTELVSVFLDQLAEIRRVRESVTDDAIGIAVPG
jgi:HD-GYP domain-containing protein (c-di-GMP phosphodiesterase class II)